MSQENVRKMGSVLLERIDSKKFAAVSENDLLFRMPAIISISGGSLDLTLPGGTHKKAGTWNEAAETLREFFASEEGIDKENRRLSDAFDALPAL